MNQELFDGVMRTLDRMSESTKQENKKEKS